MILKKIIHHGTMKTTYRSTVEVTVAMGNMVRMIGSDDMLKIFVLLIGILQQESVNIRREIGIKNQPDM